MLACILPSESSLDEVNNKGWAFQLFQFQLGFRGSIMFQTLFLKLYN